MRRPATRCRSRSYFRESRTSGAVAAFHCAETECGSHVSRLALDLAAVPQPPSNGRKAHTTTVATIRSRLWEMRRDMVQVVIRAGIANDVAMTFHQVVGTSRY